MRKKEILLKRFGVKWITRSRLIKTTFDKKKLAVCFRIKLLIPQEMGHLFMYNCKYSFLNIYLPAKTIKTTNLLHKQ